MVSPTIFSLRTMRMRHGLTDSTAGRNMELKFCICAWSTAIYQYNKGMMNDGTWIYLLYKKYNSAVGMVQNHLTALDSAPLRGGKPIKWRKKNSKQRKTFVYYLHLYDSISLKQCGLCLGIKYKGIPAQSHHAIMTLRIKRHKQMVHTE